MEELTLMTGCLDVSRSASVFIIAGVGQMLDKYVCARERESEVTLNAGIEGSHLDSSAGSEQNHRNKRNDFVKYSLSRLHLDSSLGSLEVCTWVFMDNWQFRIQRFLPFQTREVCLSYWI